MKIAITCYKTIKEKVLIPRSVDTKNAHSQECSLISVNQKILLLILTIVQAVEITVNMITIRNVNAKTALKTPLMVVYLYSLSVEIGVAPHLISAILLPVPRLTVMQTVSLMVPTVPASARPGIPTPIKGVRLLLPKAPSAVLATTIAKIIA